MLKRPAGTWETAELDLYFRDCVIGGPGAFLIPVREPSQFAEAIKLKIVREIANRPQARGLVQPAGEISQGAFMTRVRRKGRFAEFAGARLGLARQQEGSGAMPQPRIPAQPTQAATSERREARS
jgi:hypothetical protein